MEVNRNGVKCKEEERHSCEENGLNAIVSSRITHMNDAWGPVSLCRGQAMSEGDLQS
jgi:hypothetical protein